MVDFTGLLQELLTKFTSGLPNLFTAVVILLLGIFISKIISKALQKLLKSIKIDQLGEKLNDIDIVSKADVEIKISTVLSKVLYYFMLLFFAVAATDVLGLPALSDLVKDIFDMIPNLLVAGVILVIGTLVADALRNIVKTACESLGIPSAKLISMLLFYFILINVLVSAMTQAKIETDFLSQNITMLIGGAVLAFAIGYGLASKETVGNYLASSYVNGKINVGDTVQVDGVTGTIIDMDKSSVTIDTGDSKVFLPLHQLSKQSIEVK